MAQGTIEFRVDAPPEKVFALLGDLTRAPEWVPDLISVEKLGDGPVGVGTRYHEVVKMGSQTSEAELEVTDYDPPRLFAHKGRGGPSTFTGRFVMEPDGDGTRVTHEYTVQLSGFAKLMTPFITGWVRKNSEAAADNVRRLMDG